MIPLQRIKNQNMATLFLIPTTLGDTSVDLVIPKEVQTRIFEIKYFIVENIRSARRYLKKVNRDINIEELTFFTLDKRTDPARFATFLAPIKEGKDVGIISEAGCPGVADPGADIVRIAHQENIEVIPFVGPSSILLSLMASGLNGQNFAFVGYLPIKKPERIKRIKQLEARAAKESQAQIFIEAPYRNQGLFEDLVANCNPNTIITVATNITLKNQKIKSLSAKDWKKQQVNIHKELAIFLIGL